MEFAVGLMLILLGVLNLTGVLRWMQHRFSPSHAMGDLAASEEQAPEAPCVPSPNNWLERQFREMGLYNALRPLVVGTVHGLAGSAAVAILVMTTIANPWWAIAYLLLFGVGTIVGMAAMTTAMAVPIVYTGRKMFRWNQMMTVGSGLVSVAFGMFISIQIGIGGGLFTGSPHWTPR